MSAQWRLGKTTEYGTFCCGLIFAVGENNEAVAQVLGLPTNGTVEELSERYAPCLANARLIAAAPRMLTALESCRAFITGGEFDNNPYVRALRETVFTTIAEATGDVA